MVQKTSGIMLLKNYCNFVGKCWNFLFCLHFFERYWPLCVSAGSNGELVYSLLDSADEAFSIDEHSGVLRLATPLNRELHPSYTLRARATDRGWPRPLSTVCSVTVSVLDLNDDPPVFQRHDYVTTIPEDIAAGTQVLRVHAANRDAEAQISYVIVDGNEKGAFSMDTHTGKTYRLLLQCEKLYSGFI